MNNDIAIAKKINKRKKGEFNFTKVTTKSSNDTKKTIIFKNSTEVKSIKKLYNNPNYNYIIIKYEQNKITKKLTLNKNNILLNEEIYINNQNLTLKIENNKLKLFNNKEKILELTLEDDKYILNSKEDEIIIYNNDQETIYINKIKLNNINDIITLSKNINYNDEICNSIYHINLINLINEIEEKINYMKISINMYNNYLKGKKQNDILDEEIYKELLEYTNKNYEEKLVFKPKKKVRKK